MRRLELPTTEIAELRRSGVALQVIADRFGVATSVICRRLRESGTVYTGPNLQAIRTVGPDGLRPCRTCGRRLPPDSFNKNRSRPDGLNDMCRACWSQYSAERTLLRKFGLTLKAFEQLLKDQGGGCAICGHKLGILRNGKHLRLAVDHSHQTGLVRGILCNACNNGIGRFRDDPALLEKAAAYLRT